MSTYFIKEFSKRTNLDKTDIEKKLYKYNSKKNNVIKNNKLTKIFNYAKSIYNIFNCM
jgi:lantibiotic modifying enzyme